MAVIFPYLFIKARSDPFLLPSPSLSLSVRSASPLVFPSLSSSSFTMITQSSLFLSFHLWIACISSDSSDLPLTTTPFSPKRFRTFADSSFVAFPADSALNQERRASGTLLLMIENFNPLGGNLTTSDQVVRERLRRERRVLP